MFIVYLALALENQTRHSALFTGLSFELLHNKSRIRGPGLLEMVKNRRLG